MNKGIFLKTIFALRKLNKHVKKREHCVNVCCSGLVRPVEALGEGLRNLMLTCSTDVEYYHIKYATLNLK